MMIDTPNLAQSLDALLITFGDLYRYSIEQFMLLPTNDKIAAMVVAVASLGLLLFRLRPWPHKSIRRHSFQIQRSYSVLDRLSDLVEKGDYRAAFGLLRKTDAYVFEECVLSAFERSGAIVYRSIRYSGDGGVDGKVRYGKQVYLIQSKRYTHHIRKSDVQRHARLCDKHRCKGLFVHTGKTGKGTRHVAAEGPVKIVSGKVLVDVLSGHSPAVWLLDA